MLLSMTLMVPKIIDQILAYLCADFMVWKIKKGFVEYLSFVKLSQILIVIDLGDWFRVLFWCLNGGIVGDVDQGYLYSLRVY